MLVIKSGFKTGVNSVAVSPDGRWVVASPGYMPTFEPDPDDPTAKRYNFDFRYWPLPKPTKRPKTFPAERPREVRFLPSGEVLVWRWPPEPLAVFRFPDGTRIQSLFPDIEHVFPGEVSPDGRYLFVSTVARSSRLRLWDLSAGEEVKLKRTAFKHETDLPGVGGFHPTGDRVAGIPRTHVTDIRQKLYSHVAVWSFPDGKLLKSVRLKSGVMPGGVRYSPDGRHLIAVDSGSVSVWEAETLKELAQVTPKLAFGRAGPVNPRLFAPTFTPDGRFLAVGCYDGTVRLIDTRTWTEARAYDWGAATATEHHRTHGFAAVRHLAFTPDGAMGIAAVGNDLVLWDVE